MIAKAKSISHGINALNYITGVSANKKHPERIFHICDSFLPPGIDPLGIWNSVRLDSLCRPRMKNNLIRIEISPAKEHTRHFSAEDWRQLWLDFVAEFDRLEMKDKKGCLLSPKTNLAGSKSTVWLHLESDSGIPHLHAVVSRLDENGNINNDRNIHLRAQRAAERVARKRGWQTAANIHDINRQSVSRDCLDVLGRMGKWSLEYYFARLEAKGYDVKVRKDEKGIVRGYILKKGNAKFKASEFGKGRNLMVSKLEGTWNKLHPAQEQQTKADSRESDIRPDYNDYRPDTRRVDIVHDDETHTRFIPEQVMRVFDDEFDFREVENWADLINEACYHFAVAMSFMSFLNAPTYVSGGGGASNNDLPKKRDDIEEEIARARRCAAAARSKIGIVRKRGFRR
ncbi:relaxase [uncultured Muribaculum sp.]|uniref:relaxase n=1 Tax=uncultured Muribaculum sp. TaxID=1918613 RepID=UPI0025B779E8|nr:relaxase [uncultured Muribaculum sp.]